MILRQTSYVASTKSAAGFDFDMPTRNQCVLELPVAGDDLQRLDGAADVVLTVGDAEASQLEPVLSRLRDAKRVKSLRLESQLRRLPPLLTELATLQHLEIIDPALPGLPKAIGHMKRLRSLKVRAFYLASLPKSIGSLRKLRALHIDAHHLTGLPRQLMKLQELRELGLTFRGYLVNKDWGHRPYYKARFGPSLGQLFDQLAALPKLSSLTLAEPPDGWMCPDPIVHVIPRELGKLASLTELVLRRCQLDIRLPLDSPAMSRLRKLIVVNTRLAHSVDELMAALPNTQIEVRPGYYFGKTWVTSKSFDVGA